MSIIPPADIRISTPEAISNLKFNLGKPRPLRGGGGGAGTWRSVQVTHKTQPYGRRAGAKSKQQFPNQTPTFALPLRIEAVQPPVFIDGGLRSFHTSDKDSKLSIPLSLLNLQRSPTLYQIVLQLLQAINSELAASGDLPLSLPSCIWMRVDPSLKRAPCNTAQGTTAMQPISFFKGKSGHYFFTLAVAGLHLPNEGAEWAVKVQVLDLLLMENEEETEGVEGWSSSYPGMAGEPRISIPLPTSSQNVPRQPVGQESGSSTNTKRSRRRAPQPADAKGVAQENGTGVHSSSSSSCHEDSGAEDEGSKHPQRMAVRTTQPGIERVPRGLEFLETEPLLAITPNSSIARIVSAPNADGL